MEQNSDRHFYLYAKGHYKTSDDIVADLSILYNQFYDGVRSKERANLVHLVNILERMIISQRNLTEHMFGNFIEDIFPENTWRVGYITKQSMFGEKALCDYDVKLAIIYKFLSIMRLTMLKDLPFELGAPDDKVMELSTIKIDGMK